jgi:DeoR family transcriptional regulator of aga operon
MTLQRREQIAALITAQGEARVGDLSKRFAVSEVTIRNDLAELEREGRLTRDRGGAFARTRPQIVTSLAGLDQRGTQNLDRKQAIARAAAALVEPGDTLILDAGTTAVEMAAPLAAVEDLTVVTNALNVAARLGGGSSAKLILLGGAFHAESSSTLGPLAEQALAGLCVKKLFLGAQAIDPAHGLTDSTAEIAAIKRAMIKSAAEVILIADSSKWNRTGLHKVAPLEAVHRVITDPALPADIIRDLEARGIPVTLA